MVETKEEKAKKEKKKREEEEKQRIAHFEVIEGEGEKSLKWLNEKALGEKNKGKKKEAIQLFRIAKKLKEVCFCLFCLFGLFLNVFILIQFFPLHLQYFFSFPPLSSLPL